MEELFFTFVSLEGEPLIRFVRWMLSQVGPLTSETAFDKNVFRDAGKD